MSEKLKDWERQQLVEKIKGGAVFIYPTDTGCGIGCSIYCSGAIESVFMMKQRDPEKTVPVLLHHSQVDELASVDAVEREAMNNFWPGVLTLVLKAKNPGELDPHIVRNGTLALREPGLQGLVDLLKECGPVVGTSANIAGQPMPRRIEDVNPQLLQQVDFVLGDAEGQGQSSTVAAWDSSKKEWQIYREGPVTEAQLTALVEVIK
ncbi:MAG: L-threonylcarbamoyladenylate synthase [bacterium]